jgi:hypothetical protein
LWCSRNAGLSNARSAGWGAGLQPGQLLPNPDPPHKLVTDPSEVISSAARAARVGQSAGFSVRPLQRPGSTLQMLRMRFTGRIVRPLLMVMVIVVTMPVLVFHGLVDVLMIMPFGQMQPQAKGHQHPGQSKLDRETLANEAVAALSPGLPHPSRNPGQHGGSHIARCGLIFWSHPSTLRALPPFAWIELVGADVWRVTHRTP